MKPTDERDDFAFKLIEELWCDVVFIFMFFFVWVAAVILAAHWSMEIFET